MAGRDVIIGSQPIEWHEEDEFAVELGDDTSWNWFGISTSYSVDQGVESESITYLPEYGADNKLEKRTNVKLREMWSADISYHPQNFDLLQYWTGEDGGTSDDVDTLQFGEINESADPEEFRRLLGGVGDEFSISVEEDGVVEADGSLIFADSTEFETEDYVDDGAGGAHADEDATEPWTYDDLSNVQYDGTDMGGAVESVELTISNDIAEVRDTNVERGTQLSSLIPVDREITVDVQLTYDGFDMLDEVRAYEEGDFEFTIADTTFVVGGVKFPEMPYEYTADDLVSDSLSSDPASSVTWS